MKSNRTYFSKIVLTFMFIIFLTDLSKSQTIQFGIFNIEGNLVVKVKPTANISNKKLTGMVFAIRWLSSYGITLGSTSSDYGIAKGGYENKLGIYVYQNFYFPQDPLIINWSGNTEYQILSVALNHTDGGLGIFELCPFGFTSDFHTDPYIEIELYNYINSQTPFYQSSTSLPLPVELTSFTTRVAKTDVILKWKTATELNNYGFEIQKAVMNTRTINDQTSINTDDWSTIGFVKGNGNSNSPKEYSYVDKNPTWGKVINYRLKQIDNDGKYSFSSIESVKLEALEYKLMQNFPNPFNPSTKICFTLPEACKIKIQIMNLLGEVVKTLIDENKEAGYHEIDFNANKLCSGIYFYVMSAGKYSETRKMLLLK